jgi:hypothetical protein
MELQQQTNWCWAAVTAAIHNFRNPGDTRTQGEVATPTLVKEHQIAQTVDCNKNPELCNFQAALDDALDLTKDLSRGGFLPNQFLDFESIQGFLDRDRPIAVRIVWEGGGAHFVAVDGYFVYSSGQQCVHVEDPASGPNLYFYDDLVQHYPPDNGHWQDTYLVKR